MNTFEQQQMFATGIRQLIAERAEQGRREFDRAWAMADVIKPAPQPRKRVA